MSTTSIRIKDNVYSRLELNAKGFESVSDTISRSNMSLETLEALDMIDMQVGLSVQCLDEEGITRERILLMHYHKDAIQKAINIVVRLYPDHKIDYKIDVNMCVINVAKKNKS